MAALDDVRQLRTRAADDGRQRADLPLSAAAPARVPAALPEVHVTVQRALASRIPAQVLDYGADMGVVTFRPDDLGLLTSIVVYHGRTGLRRAAGPPAGARRKKCSIEELAQESFVAHHVLAVPPPRDRDLPGQARQPADAGRDADHRRDQEVRGDGQRRGAAAGDHRRAGAGARRAGARRGQGNHPRAGRCAWCCAATGRSRTPPRRSSPWPRPTPPRRAGATSSRRSAENDCGRQRRG